MITPWVDPDTHGWVHHPRDDVDWAKLLAEYGAAANHPLANVFGAARANRCRTVTVENRYIEQIVVSEIVALGGVAGARATQIGHERRRVARQAVEPAAGLAQPGWAARASRTSGRTSSSTGNASRL